MSTNLFDLCGKVAVVTGAGANGGIGHVISIGFAGCGVDLVVSDVDDQGLVLVTSLSPPGYRVFR
jgi:NAD(P)-dependent dehydrogenase (short-subunit alcohol dehydrogenase family)